MGMFIAPFLLVALWVSIIAMIKTVRLLKNKEINSKEIISGLAISVAIFGLMCLSILNKKEIWAFSPYFNIPIIMVFFPYAYYLFYRKSTNLKLKYYASIALISTRVTGILAILYFNLFDGLIDILGIIKTH
jgi:hypothetical protein